MLRLINKNVFPSNFFFFFYLSNKITPAKKMWTLPFYSHLLAYFPQSDKSNLEKNIRLTYYIKKSLQNLINIFKGTRKVNTIFAFSCCKYYSRCLKIELSKCFYLYIYFFSTEILCSKILVIISLCREILFITGNLFIDHLSWTLYVHNSSLRFVSIKFKSFLFTIFISIIPISSYSLLSSFSPIPPFVSIPEASNIDIFNSLYCLLLFPFILILYYHFLFSIITSFLSLF